MLKKFEDTYIRFDAIHKCEDAGAHRRTLLKQLHWLPVSSLSFTLNMYIDV